MVLIFLSIEMSGQPPSAAGAPAPRNPSNGAANVGMVMPPQPRTNDGQIGASAVGGQNGNPSQQNLNSIVSDGSVPSSL